LDHKPSSKVDYTAVSSLHDRFKPVASTHAPAAHFKPPDNSLFRKSEGEGERSKECGCGWGDCIVFSWLSLRPSGTREVPSPAALVCRPRTISAHDSHEWMTSVKHHAVSANCTRGSLELCSQLGRGFACETVPHGLFRSSRVLSSTTKTPSYEPLAGLGRLRFCLVGPSCLRLD
jgi:hypothetical protein